MSSAILAGAVRRGVLDLSRVVVADPSPEKRASFPNGVACAADALAWLAEQEGDADPADRGQVMLAVKPQIFPLVAEEIRGMANAGPSRVVLSILAGTTSDAIRSALTAGSANAETPGGFGGEGARVVRIMPNTPAQVGFGMSAIAGGAGSNRGDDAFANRLMESVGEVVRIEESMMDAFTGLAGSGPAYVFYLAEALAKAGVGVGFNAEDADRIARAVVIGSARLLEEDGRSAADLRRAVTSPKGTTQAGTEKLDAEGVMDAVARAVAAARDRGAELARGG